MREDLINLSDKVYVIKGDDSCNIYFFDYKYKVIIDSGHPKDIEKNIKVLKNSGINLSEINFLINTHSHGDHIGANAFFKKINPDLKIIAHKNQKSFLEIQKKIKLLKGAEIEFEEYTPDIYVDNNDKIELGDDYLEILYTPGHTIDSISLLLRTQNAIFTGDLIYNKVITQLNYYQDLRISLLELKKSYERLSSLLPLTVYPGHGEKINLTKETMEVLNRKIKKLENNNESLLINTLIPSVEFYVLKHQGITYEKLKNYFFENMLKLKDNLYALGLNENDFLGVVDKMLALMKFLNIIKEENNSFYSVNRANYYLNINR